MNERVMKMYKIAENVYDLIGNTPLYHALRTEKKFGARANILAKLEYFNPAGSVKDRVGYNMIKDAEDKGILKPGAVIIEPTSGNTGIGLAAVAAAKGYRAIFTMPDTMSIERRRLLSAYGAEIVLTPGADGMSGAIKKADELKKTIEGAFIPGQFDNESNPQAHVLTTGPEIWEQTEGRVDAVVAGIGTGGTITGIAEYLKSKNPAIRIIGYEPETSPFLTQGHGGAHQIQGIGAGFEPKVFEKNLCNEIMTVGNEQALSMGREFARTEGILVGISSGGAIWAAIEVSKRQEFHGKNIVVILPDSGERYLSSAMYE
jgi:cysteine synthase A